jgi:DNA-directed RNA polymerase subunit L
LNLKINPAGEGSIKVEIEREDYSLADIVHKELLNVKHVKFSGVAPPHPLIKTLTLEVSTDSNNPTKALIEALELSKGRVSELLILAKEAFPQAPSASEKVGSEAATPRKEAATSPSDDESSSRV